LTFFDRPFINKMGSKAKGKKISKAKGKKN